MKYLFDDQEKKETPPKNSFCFFENKDCQCYPCHNIKEINCMFCYCPLYHLKDCGGNYTYIGNVKDCTKCVFPHIRDNYHRVIERLVLENDKNKTDTND